MAKKGMKKGAKRPRRRDATDGKGPKVYEHAVQDLASPPRPHWRTALKKFVEEIKGLYGPRLVSVVLFGSRARGDAEIGSDIDTLVVLDRCDDFWAEHDRICEVAIRVSAEHDIVISGFPAGAQEFEQDGSPFYRNVRREGVSVV